MSFYEDFLLDPSGELARVNAFISKKSYTPSAIIEALIKKPSKVTTHKKTQFEIDEWKKSITDEQYRKSQDILKAFGFDQLYLIDSRPNPVSLHSYKK